MFGMDSYNGVSALSSSLLDLICKFPGSLVCNLFVSSGLMLNRVIESLKGIFSGETGATDMYCDFGMYVGASHLYSTV